jgi:hypothetical protein
MQFVVTARHSPEHCPSSNAKIRQLMKEGAKQNPELAKRLGVKILTMSILPTDHEALTVVEADRIEAVQEFAMQSRLMQWNTVSIRPAWGMEEALAKADALTAIF